MNWNPLTWLPFGRAGRQTLIYMTAAGAGPVLTGVVIWAMTIIERFPDTHGQQRLDAFAKLAYLVGSALMIIVISLACFISIRALRIGKDGISAEGDGDGGGDNPTITTTTKTEITPGTPAQ